MRHDESKIGRSVQSRPDADEQITNRRQRRIDAYPTDWRPAIDQVARMSSALEDLAESFPGLLFALATGYGSEAERKSALTAVTGGMPLKEAASRLGLPFWLRKLPAAAFTRPLGTPPGEPALVNRLVSLIPPTPAAAAAWLERVLVAHATGRPELTLWVAQQYRAPQPSGHSATFLFVLGWAWFSTIRPPARAHALLTERWTPTMGARRAAVEAKLWRERIALDVYLGPGLSDTWLKNGAVGDISFVALRTADDFIAEARVMDNCLDRYADRLSGRVARVFSVQRDGNSIADIEIAPHEGEPGHPVIAQLRGPHNRRAPLEVWQAAYAWIGGQPLRIADKRLAIKLGSATRIRRQTAIWQPYLQALPEAARELLCAAIMGRAKRRRAGSAARAHTARPS